MAFGKNVCKIEQWMGGKEFSVPYLLLCFQRNKQEILSVVSLIFRLETEFEKTEKNGEKIGKKC